MCCDDDGGEADGIPDNDDDHDYDDDNDDGGAEATRDASEYDTKISGSDDGYDVRLLKKSVAACAGC